MAQIYGELIRAQLQSATSGTIGAAVPGLIYLNSGDKKPTVYDGTSWQKLVNEAALADLSALPIITLAKGGLGADASAWSGFVKISAGTASAAALSASDLPIVTAAKGGLGADASAFAGVVKAAAGVFSASTIVNTDVSATAAIDYSKLSVPDAAIPQAKVANLTTDLAGKVTANLAITGATKTKITYDSKGLVTAGADLVSADIPATLLSKVVSSTPAMTGALTLPVGTTSDRTGLSTQGMVRYNTTDATFEGYNGVSWGAIGGGGGGTIDTITQASHGFVVGDVLYLNGSTYTKAIASAANTAEVVGVVSSVITSSQFQLTLSGEVSGLTGLVAGEVYFLSATTPGALTVTEPTTIGHVSLPVGVASSSTTLYVAPKRGVIVGGVNARTQIPLANNATTTVQNVATYEAGELSGWIAISATTPLKFYVTAQFSKNGAGNNYNISYQTSGDTPPVGFVLQVTAAGLIQAVLPSITGFASASITYGLDVAAIGTTFPLSLDASLISGNFSNVNFTNRIFAKQGGLNNFEMGFGAGTGNTDFFGLYGAANKNIALFANEQQQMLVTGQGVQIRGRTDGAAVQTGYIGESVSINLSGTPIALGTWTGFSGQNITLTRGTWILIAYISINILNCSDFSAGLSTNFSNDSSNLLVSVQQSKITTKQTGNAPLFLTTPYIVSGSSQILYLKTWMGDGTLGPVSINGMFIRIA